MVLSAEDQILIKVDCKQSWPESGRLPYLRETAGACLPQPDLWCGSAEVTCDRRVWTIPHFQQSLINEAVKQWHQHLQACIWAHKGHFEVEHNCSIFLQRRSL